MANLTKRHQETTVNQDEKFDQEEKFDRTSAQAEAPANELAMYGAAKLHRRLALREELVLSGANIRALEFLAYLVAFGSNPEFQEGPRLRHHTTD